ncbi:MAG: ABC transporter ATP-binding protein [Candidatus Zixiibacteriota bacterium]
MNIKIRSLTQKYPGGKYALKDINLDIGSGMFGLLGPNGAGKTTLMRILVTLLKPTGGEVNINGMDLQKNRKKIRKLVGYLPQEFSNFPKLAVWEFLDYAGSISGIKSKSERMTRVDELLEQVGLFDVRDRFANKLSGGMKRRLGIAQTLVGRPKIIIVDEPTVGLDPQERLRFRNLMADLTREDVIIILSTHIVGDISSTCSEVALLNYGKIVFNEHPSRLIEKAKNKVWKINVSHEELDFYKEKYPVISAIPSIAGYELRLVADRIEGIACQPLDSNLEDAYIYFMQSIGYDMNLESETNGLKSFKELSHG